MFAGIDIASERHMLARLDDAGQSIGKPLPISEDRDGYDALLKALGPPPVLVVMEATGHYWKNVFAVLVAAGHHVVLLDRFVSRRFQHSKLERTKTDGIDARGLARFGFGKRPAPTRLNDEGAEALRELVRHRDSIRQDFDDRVRQLHRLVDLGFPEFTRYVRTLDSMLATCLLAAYPTTQAFARAPLRRLAQAALRRASLRRTGSGPPSARSASITVLPTRCRPSTSARISISGEDAWPMSSMTSWACWRRTRSAGC